MSPSNRPKRDLAHILRRIRRFAVHPLMLSFYIPALLVSIGTGLLSPVLPLFVKELGGSYGWVGLVLSAPLLGNLLADIPAGMVLRVWGHRKAMVSGIALTVVMTMLCFWIKSLSGAFFLLLLSGIGTSLFSVARHTFITEQVSVDNRGRAIAAFGGMSRIGRFIGPLIGGAVGAAYGLRAPFLIYGILGGLGVLSVLIAAVSVPKISKGQAHNHEEQVSVRDVIQSRLKLLVPGGVGQLFAQMIRNGRSAIIPLYAADVIGLNVDAIGTLLSIASFVEMTLFYPAGYIMDNWGRKYAIVPSFLIQAVAMACVPLTSTYITLLFCVITIGAGNGLSSGGMMTLGADLSPEKGRGEFLGVWRLIGDIGGSGGPYLVGAVADAVALPSAALVMAAAGLVAASVFGFLLPETRKHKIE
jgi:MFS family permease